MSEKTTTITISGIPIATLKRLDRFAENSRRTRSAAALILLELGLLLADKSELETHLDTVYAGAEKQKGKRP